MAEFINFQYFLFFSTTNKLFKNVSDFSGPNEFANIPILLN